MTDPNATLIAALLDRSGSMETSKHATEDGWRELINEQRLLPGQCQVTLAQFDTVYEVLYSATPVADVEFVVEPRGRTALLDATGKFITEIGEQLSALPEDQRPGHVICLIMTDGIGERQPRMELGRRAETHQTTTASVELEVHLHRGEHGRNRGGRANGLRARRLDHLRRFRLRLHSGSDAFGQGNGAKVPGRREFRLLERRPDRTRWVSRRLSHRLVIRRCGANARLCAAHRVRKSTLRVDNSRDGEWRCLLSAMCSAGRCRSRGR